MNQFFKVTGWTLGGLLTIAALVILGTWGRSEYVKYQELIYEAGENFVLGGDNTPTELTQGLTLCAS
jgi:hypothetical protein